MSEKTDTLPVNIQYSGGRRSDKWRALNQELLRGYHSSRTAVVPTALRRKYSHLSPNSLASHCG